MFHGDSPVTAKRVRLWLWGAASAATALLVYASLVPLQYEPLSWADTGEQWWTIPWLDLSIFNRADWVANALVVMPSGFLAAAAVDLGRPHRTALFLATPVIAIALSALVFGIELVQIWFPPRTVSQNDIFAGCIGAWLGPLAWILVGRQIGWSLKWLIQSTTVTRRLQWLCAAAFCAVLLYNVMPLDLVLSQDELEAKIALGRIQYWPSLESVLSVAGVKGIVLSMLRLFPLGAWLGLAGWRTKAAFPLLAIFALITELIQIPIFTKSFATVEVFAGFVGGWLGIVIGQQPLWLMRLIRSPWAWRAATAVVLLCITGYSVLRFDRVVSDRASLQDRIDLFFAPPLLRYYYTSEYAALSNLAAKLLIFGLLGFLWAGSGEACRERDARPRFWIGLIAVSMLGLGIEIAQLFLEPLIGDATDLLIYAAGYTGGFIGFRGLVSKPSGQTAHGASEPAVARPVNKLPPLGGSFPSLVSAGKTTQTRNPQSLAPPTKFDRTMGHGLSLICALAAVMVCGMHPRWSGLCLGAAGLCAATTFFRPVAFLVLFSLLLVAADAYVWTGQLVLQEYDALLLAAAAGVWWQVPPRWSGVLKSLGTHASWWIWFASVGVAFWIGSSQLPAADYADQLSVYVTRWNAWRELKGWAWGGLFLVSWLALKGQAVRRVDAFAFGMQLALLYVGWFVAFERWRFESLWDFTELYRATGPFATMHIGDQHLDAFLVLALPFAWVGCTGSPQAIRRSLWAIMLSGLAIYAALASMSRATIAAIGIECSAILLWMVVNVLVRRYELRTQQISVAKWAGSITAGLMFAGLFAAGGILVSAAVIWRSEALRSRFEGSKQDLQTRVEHWRTVLNLRGTSGLSKFAGTGLGTLPSRLFEEGHLPTPPLAWEYGLVDGGISQQEQLKAGIVRIKSGLPIYLQLRLPDSARFPLGIEFEIRSSDPSSRLQVSVCEQAMLQSYACSNQRINGYSGRPGFEMDWRRVAVRLERPKPDGSGHSRRRPLVVSVAASGDRATVELRDFRISSVDGQLLSISHDASNHSSPWFFSCDDHLIWRSKNALVHVLYAQGWLGVLAGFAVCGVFVVCALGAMADPSTRVVAGLILIAAIGFAAVASFGTLIDTPWIVALLVAVLAIGMNLTTEERHDAIGNR